MIKSLRFLLFLFFALLVLNDLCVAQVTFGTGMMNVRVDTYGAIRIFTTEGTDTVQHINRASFLVAGNMNQVLDYWNDVDVEIATTLETTPEHGDYEISGTYNNAFSGLPPNALVEQHVYGWNNQNFCLIKMIVTNQEGSALPMIVGLDIIQYVDETWENDNVFYDATNQLLTQFESHYVGIKILSEQTLSAKAFMWYSGYSDSDSAYYAWLTAGTLKTDTLLTDPDGAVGILGGESMELQSAESRVVYMAISAGTNEAEMLNNMDMAIQEYQTITFVELDNNLTPTEYILNQNYPNPFNPSTIINFSTPNSGYVLLKVYDLLGNEVETLVSEELAAGNYKATFNASRLTSGTYFYTLSTGNFSQTNKMLLIK